jgi:hypothetical protein
MAPWSTSRRSPAARRPPRSRSGDFNEDRRTFYLDLFGLSSNALFTRSRGIGTIWNDD